MSVAIPTHGHPKYLIQALESIQAQTHQPDQVVVAVDGDPDQTSELLRARFPHVEVLPSVGQQGESFTRNRALRASTSDWIFLLDSDDLMHRDRIAICLEYVRSNPQCRALRAPFWVFSETQAGPNSAWGLHRDFAAKSIDECHLMANSPPTNDFSYLEIQGRSHEIMLINNRGAISTTAIERSLLAEIELPPDHGIRCGVDWLLFTRIARIAEWHLLPSPVGFQRLHDEQDTRTGGLGLAEGVLEAKILAWSEERSYRLQDYGIEYRDEFRRFLWSAVRNHDVRGIGRIARRSSRLLPLWQDRLALAVPPRVATRWPSKERPKTRIEA